MIRKIVLFFGIFFTISVLLLTNVYAFCIDRTPPSAPKNLRIYDSPYDSDGNITLVWDPATDGPCENSAVAYYNIYRSDDGINFVLIGNTTLTTFDDFSSLPEGRYWYRVTAVDNVIDNPHEGPAVENSTTVIFTPWCSDGTYYGECSATKPKYCDNGNLIDRCDICGCPSGQDCRADGTCYTPTIGRGVGGYVCIPNWTCTDWSACLPEGKQTRTCTDLNNCGTTAGKPAEIQDCTYVEEYCGDGTCQEDENCSICPADCGPCPLQIIVCGNGVCEAGEDYTNCCSDCSCPGGMVCNTTTNACYTPAQPLGITGLVIGFLSNPVYGSIIAIMIIVIIVVLLRKKSSPRKVLKRTR